MSANLPNGERRIAGLALIAAPALLLAGALAAAAIFLAGSGSFGAALLSARPQAAPGKAG